MDPELKKKALEALLADDAEACKEILKALVTDAPAEGGDGPAPAREETPADDAAPTAPPARAYGRDDEGPPMARRRAVLDAETARARKGADLAVATGIRGRLREVRAEGLELDAKLEAELAAMRDPDAFEQRISDLTRGRSMASAGSQRARSGVGHEGAPAPGDAGASMTAAQLAAEGFSPQWIAEYQREHQADPRAAAATLDGGRAARARKSANAGRGN